MAYKLIENFALPNTTFILINGRCDMHTSLVAYIKGASFLTYNTQLVYDFALSICHTYLVRSR